MLTNIFNNLNHFFSIYFKNLPFFYKNMGTDLILLVLFLLIVFYYIGLKFPDIDLKIKGLGHRSILTHSPLLTVGLWILHKKNYLWLVYKGKYDITNYVIIGLALGIAVHLLYDLRPKSFKGSALITYPYVKGSLSINESIIFMLISVLINLFLVISYVKTLYEMLILFILFIITLIKKKNVEKGFWTTIIFFILIFFGCIYYKPTIIKKYNAIRYGSKKMLNKANIGNKYL